MSTGSTAAMRMGETPARPGTAGARPRRERRTSARPYIYGAFAVIAVLCGGVALWAVTTEIAGAVIAPATVVVDSNVKKIQHPTGGVVGEIRVRNGDRVKAGDLMIRLDETVTRANLQIVTKQLDELMLRAARLAAERDGAAEITLPAELLARRDDPAIVEIVKGETSLFNTRRRTLHSQEEQLRERTTQLDQEAAGLDAQRNAKGIEIELIGKEIESLSTLEEQKLVTSTKMMSLRRDAARLQGEHALLLSSAAQTKGKMTEIELTILQRQQEFSTEVVKELREVQTKIAEYAERRIAAEDQLRRIEIRAPADGIVHQLAVHTIGGVISNTEPLLLLVPHDDKLVIEAQVAPKDRDQLVANATAVIRFAAFNQRTTPEIRGTVAGISADLTEDRRTGLSYYSVRITIPESELAKLGSDNKLVPGMPADAQIKTHDRTAYSYLVKPIEDQLAKAWRER